MARVRLELAFTSNNAFFRFVRPGGVRAALPSLHVRVRASLVPHVRPGGSEALRAGLPLCILDTGAPLSIVPEYIWAHFLPGAVTPLPFDSAMPFQHRSVTVGGGRFPFDLGELDIRLTDSHQRTVNLRVVAQFARDGGALTIPIVLGLSGGALDGRVLRSEPDPAAPFGQAWSLEDP